MDTVSNRHIVQDDGPTGSRKIIVLAPSSTKMTSYHIHGKSDGELYRENWRKTKCLKEEFRL